MTATEKLADAEAAVAREALGLEEPVSTLQGEPE